MTPEGLVLVQTLLCSSLYYTREICDARGELHQLEEGLGRLRIHTHIYVLYLLYFIFFVGVLSDQLIKENHGEK